MCLPELLDDSATTDPKASDQGAPPWENRPADKYHDAPGSSFRLSRERSGSFRRILLPLLALWGRTPVVTALPKNTISTEGFPHPANHAAQNCPKNTHPHPDSRKH